MLLNSFSKKYNRTQTLYDRKDHIYELQDKLAADLSSLIARVAKGEINRSVLENEIEKKCAENANIKNPSATAALIMDNIYGYGWLQPYIEDPEISDIDILSYDSIMLRKKGEYFFVPSEFEDERQLGRFLKYVVIRNGGTINEAKPHCRVADYTYKLRINACIEPRNATGASLTIRKHSNRTLKLEELRKIGMFDEEMEHLIRTMCAQKKNILICGKGAAGKTTLLRAVINSAEEMERILVCEKDAEIFPERKNCIVQRISKRVSGEDVYDLNSMIEEGLTMSLDTYCIGEITGKEAWPLIKAGYSDHRTLATIHAQSASDALDRLLMLCMDDNRLSESKVMEMIRRSIDIIIYMKHFKIEEIYFPNEEQLSNRPAKAQLREDSEKTLCGGVRLCGA